MTGSTFRLQILVPKRPSVESRELSREEFYEWVWREFSHSGLLGVHEGTLLSEEAAEKGLETESWTVDAGEAPRERDWIESLKTEQAELYFNSKKSAESAAKRLKAKTSVETGRIEEQKPQDWDAEWKASFLASGGVTIPPFWRIVPPWYEEGPKAGEKILKINPGAGFGTGTHETTQLCLQAIADFWPKGSEAAEVPVLDFGSGSGILSIGAALLAGKVDGVEIDPLAIDNANDNAALNGIQNGLQFSRDLSSAPGPYRLVIANILRPVLIEFADQLVERLARPGTVILSGLIETDVPQVRERYSKLLGKEPIVRALNEWRALIWPGV